MRMVSRNWNRGGTFASVALALLASLMTLVPAALAQDFENEGTGLIKGTVTSTSGVPLAGAQLIFTDRNTGKTSAVRTAPNGSFASPELAASDYNVRVEAPYFITTTIVVPVKADQTATVNVSLAPLPVPGVVPFANLELLPFRNLNFLQFPQLEPGLRSQNAGAVRASTVHGDKDAFSSLVRFDRAGTAAPVEIDGLSITDRTSGGVTENIPPGAVQEFQLGGLLAPIASQLYAPGAINFVSRSGSNDLHGDLFGFYGNGNAVSASLPGGHNHDWGRQQFGGNLGGALVKDKLFFFLGVQRNRLDVANQQLPAGAFQDLSPLATTLREPFRETEGTARFDYKWSDTASAFYRFGYDQTSDVAPFSSGPNLQPLLARTNTPSHTFGVNLESGAFVHALRFQYLKFRDVTAPPAGAVNPIIPPLAFSVNIGGGATNHCSNGALFCVGPNPFSNQQNYQSDKQFRYDGSRVSGNHQWHFGASFNRMLTGRFDPLYANAPALSSQSTVPLPGGLFGSSGLAADPLAYPAQWVFLSNGRGFESEKSGFGLPAGALSDNQLAFYAGDTWKVLPSLSLTYGVRWVRDTVPNNSDLASIPQLSAWQSKLGDRVRQPNLNFAPQLGFSWDPGRNGASLIHGGIGLFYDQPSFINAYLDRSLRLQQGTYLTTPAACVGGTSGRIQWPAALPPGMVVNNAGIVNPDGTVSPYDPAALRSWCGESMGAVGPMAIALQQAYQSATAAATSNPSYIGNPTGFAGPYQNGLSLLPPNYQTPRTVQMDVGLRHELRPGLIFRADYVREVTTRTLLGVDMNHGGAAATFNAANAAAARDFAQTNATSFGGSTNCAAGPGQVSCMLASLGSPMAVLDAYGSAGIGGPAQVTGGAPCPFCAFPGVHPNLGVAMVNIPEGRSVYTGANVSLTQEMTGFARGVRHTTFQATYSHSTYVSQGADLGFSAIAPDFDNPDRFTGPSAFDRKHQISLAAFFDLSKSFQLSFLGQFASPLPVTLRFPQVSGGAEVLVTDWTGDGSVADIIPGSNIGSYMRNFSASGLERFIGNYNATFPASTTPVTPAGGALVNAGVFSLQELHSIGGGFQPLASNVQDVAGLGWLKTFDLRLGWQHQLGERIVLAPSVSVFNLFNFANFDLPGNTQNGVLNFGAGSASPWATALQPQNTVGGSTPAPSSRLNRATLSGMNATGAPRTVEWGLKISF